MSMIKVRRDDKDSKATKLSEEELSMVNDLVISLTVSALRHFDHKPTGNKVLGKLSPVPKNQWKRMLLLNLFDACAMSYRVSVSKFTKTLIIANRMIAGQQCEGFYTGSMAEGVGCASAGDFSDTDIMNVLKNFKAVYHSHRDNESVEDNVENKTDKRQLADRSGISETLKVVRLSTGSNPGYTKLTKCEATEQLIKIASALNYGPVIRSSKTEELLAHEFEFDDAIAVECESWPSESLPWLSRNRSSGWPSLELAEKCAKIPCYIVSKSHAENPENEYEWRFSFARQEGLIFRAMPIKVKMVYILTKFLIKNLRIEENLLSTYQLKTMFLWHCEQKSEEEFNKKELEASVEDFLSFIVVSLEDHKVQNYFIPQNNMISHITSDAVKGVKQKVEYVMPNLFALCKRIQTAKSYPFSIQGIAASLENGSEAESMLIRRIQSNFLHITVELILSSHLPLTDCMWLFLPYILQRNEHCSALEEENIHYLHLIQLIQRKSDIICDVFGTTFVKLATLYFASRAELSSEISSLCSNVLVSTFENMSSNIVSNSLAEVLRLFGLEKGLSVTKRCCYLISEWVTKHKTGSDILMHTWQKVITVMDLAENKHNKLLLSRLNEIAILLAVSPSDIEVGLATVLRLYHNVSAIESLETFCSMRDDISLDGAQKQLVYATFLFLENGSVSNESENSLKSSKALFSSKVYSSAAATFCFVVSVVVYQKLSNGDRSTVQKFLALVQSSQASENCVSIQELKSIVVELLSTPELDLANAFYFVLNYTQPCMVSTSLSFVLSVLDELVPPHINLGVLSAIGIELSATSEIDLAIECLETWVRRSTEASVVQNKALPVKIFGKLGHLHHIKLQSTNDKCLLRKYRNKANVYFQSALQEDVTNTAAIGDYLLFCKPDHEEFRKYAELVLALTDTTEISTYPLSSMPALNEYGELRGEIEINGDIQLCSSVFVRYLICHDNGFAGKCSENHVQDMKNTLGQLKEVIHNQEEAGSNVEMQKTVLSDSWRILGYCAAQTGMDEEAIHALSEAKSLSQPRCGSSHFNALLKEMEAKEISAAREQTLYSRI